MIRVLGPLLCALVTYAEASEERYGIGRGTYSGSSIPTPTASLPASISECLSGKASWSKANASWFEVASNAKTLIDFDGTHRTTNVTGALLGTVLGTRPTPFATCDGVAYAHGSIQADNITWTTTIIKTEYTITTPYPTPAPSCSLGSDECSQWWTSHIVCSRSDFVSSSYAHPSLVSTDFGTASAWCSLYFNSEAAPCAQPTNMDYFPVRRRNCYACYVSGLARLHYWPVTLAAGGDYCAPNATTVTASGQPMTATISGIPVVSPDVAFVVDWLKAEDYCGDIGTVESNLVLTMPATEVSSVEYRPVDYEGFANPRTSAFDFGHLPPGRVPAHLWWKMFDCGYSYFQDGHWNTKALKSDATCGTVYVDQYAPSIPFPKKLSTRQAVWSSASCSRYISMGAPVPLIPINDNYPRDIVGARTRTSGSRPASVSASATPAAEIKKVADSVTHDLSYTQGPSGIYFPSATTNITLEVGEDYYWGIYAIYPATGTESEAATFSFFAGQSATLPTDITIGAVASTTTYASPIDPSMFLTYQPGTGLPNPRFGKAGVTGGGVVVAVPKSLVFVAAVSTASLLMLAIV